MNHWLLLIKLVFICIFVLVFKNNDKIKNSYINNYIVIILKKIIGGKYATLLDDFALESSENLTSIFLRINSAESIAIQTHHLLSHFFVRCQQIIHTFEGILV